MRVRGKREWGRYVLAGMIDLILTSSVTLNRLYTYQKPPILLENESEWNKQLSRFFLA